MSETQIARSKCFDGGSALLYVVRCLNAFWANDLFTAVFCLFVFFRLLLQSWLIFGGIVVSNSVTQIVRGVLRSREYRSKETPRVIWSESGPARGLRFFRMRREWCRYRVGKLAGRIGS
jgi:hypothetical protein